MPQSSFIMYDEEYKEITAAVEDAVKLLPAPRKVWIMVPPDAVDEVINKIKVNFSDLTRHHFYPGMPRTSNIGEGVISRLDSKINQADGYAGYDTAWATLKMLIMRYRFKKFTDCRKKNIHKNGKSPLELCGVDVSNINWIKFSQRA